MLGGTMSAAIGFAVLTLFSRQAVGRFHYVIPQWMPASIYLWHFLILPLTVIGLLIGLATKWIHRLQRKVRGIPTAMPVEEPAPIPTPASLWSRRNFLAATALTAPPLAAAALTGRAMGRIRDFRIRPFDLALKGWPAALDGFSMAVIADVHTGMFTTPKMLRDIADSANNMRADVILLAGDLINISHADLPSALDMVAGLDARSGVFMIQGNHDLIQGEERFDAACRARGMRLLVDEVETLRPRGIPIQLLGARWPRFGAIDDSVISVTNQRDPDLFPILLAHHPHCFDEASRQGIPLVLSGHTHGGQIMFTDRIGAGPIRFKYWTGLYEKPNCKLIVSNGVGNWFPLRVNAPAELLKITLHPAAT